jgi:hypothetical protein
MDVHKIEDQTSHLFWDTKLRSWTCMYWREKLCILSSLLPNLKFVIFIHHKRCQNCSLNVMCICNTTWTIDVHFFNEKLRILKFVFWWTFHVSNFSYIWEDMHPYRWSLVIAWGLWIWDFNVSLLKSRGKSTSGNFDYLKVYIIWFIIEVSSQL